jgi:hypothetical protein
LCDVSLRKRTFTKKNKGEKMKMTPKVIGMMVVAAFLAAAGSATAVQTLPDNMMNDMREEVSRSISSSLMDTVVANPPTEAASSTVSPEMQLSLAQLVSQALQSLPEEDSDKITTKMAARHIYLMERQKGLGALTPEEADQLATTMAAQEMPWLREFIGEKESGAKFPNPLTEKVREQIMNKITDDIASHNQSVCRPLVQPHVVQGMIKQIRPWEFPSRVQLNTIPMFTPKIIKQVKEHFGGKQNLPSS